MYYRSTADARAAKRFQQPFSAYDEHYLNTFYTFKDPDGRRYRLSDLTAPGQGSRGHPKYEFLGVTRYWRYNKVKMEQLHKKGLVEFRPTGKVPFRKVYLGVCPSNRKVDVFAGSKTIPGSPIVEPGAFYEVDS